MKKIIPIFLFAFIQIMTIHAASKISIKQFGAKGDGRTNDHEAFNKAASYINKQKHSITLTIPAGTYIIGKQIPGTTWLMEGSDAMLLQNCKNVNIVGEVKNGRIPTLKYAPGLLFGCFYKDGPKKLTPKCTPVLNNYDRTSNSMIGSCFNIYKCRNITISNLEIDGNQNGMLIGGYYGDNGRQLNHRGFFLQASDFISLNNVFVHHLGLDGIDISGTSNTVLKNVISNYNGRQALSWLDGNGLKATNCKFNYTGNSRVATAPGSGLDIEPDNGSSTSNGVFTNCEFMYNTGCGLVNDYNNNAVKNIIFQSCTFVGYYNWAVWIVGTKIKFNDCKIYGHCTNMARNKFVETADDITTFNHCFFSNVYKQTFCKKMSNYLLDFTDVKVRMQDCSIDAYDVGFLWHVNSDTRPGLESMMVGANIRSNNASNSHSSASGIAFRNCNLTLTEKIPFNILTLENNNNKVNLLPKTNMDNDMKASSNKPFVSNINPYNCSEK